MPNYTIEAHGDVRELYHVEAKDVEGAFAKWEAGEVDEPFVSEAEGMSIYRITKDED